MLNSDDTNGSLQAVVFWEGMMQSHWTDILHGWTSAKKPRSVEYIKSI